ncbi:MAG: LamG domain-containing protein [Planctomycetaceae bacterium]
MLLTGSDAIVVGEGKGETPLALNNVDALPTGDFTIEAVVLLESLYADATVRTIAAHWDANTQHPGWALGVTSTKSAFTPRNLIMQFVGTDKEGKLQYEVVPSGLHLELGKPYYIACSVKLDGTGEQEVTFYVQDIAAENDNLRVAQMPHKVVAGIHNADPLLIGGRAKSDRHRWHGLIDEVRLTNAALSQDELLPIAATDNLEQASVPNGKIVGYWTFDQADNRLTDTTGQGEPLLPLDQPIQSEAPWTDFCHVLLNSNEFLYLD